MNNRHKPTKFEIATSTHYEDRKGDTKSRKIEWFGAVRGRW